MAHLQYFRSSIFCYRQLRHVIHSTTEQSYVFMKEIKEYHVLQKCSKKNITAIAELD
jgi:hypothetical protein